MDAEPWDRAEDLFIRQRLKERCSPEQIAERMSSVGYRRTTEAVTKRCHRIRAVLAAETKARNAEALRGEDDPRPDLQRQNQAFLKAMLSADPD